MPTIPKTMHFIWLGKDLPDDFFTQNVTQFRIMNPDFEVQIWIDSEDSGASFASELRDLLLSQFDLALRQVFQCRLKNEFIRHYQEAIVRESEFEFRKHCREHLTKIGRVGELQRKHPEQVEREIERHVEDYRSTKLGQEKLASLYQEILTARLDEYYRAEEVIHAVQYREYEVEHRDRCLRLFDGERLLFKEQSSVRPEGMLPEDDPVLYEMKRLRPNYGAASDLIRYRVLEKGGGIYYDWDVSPPDYPLSDTCAWWQGDGEHRHHALYFPKIIREGTPRLASDVIVCTRGNKSMEAIRKAADANYHVAPLLREDNVFLWRLTYRSEDLAVFCRDTIARTGPGHIKKIRLQLAEKGVPIIDVTIPDQEDEGAVVEAKEGEPARAVPEEGIIYDVEQAQLRQPLDGSATSWVKKRLKFQGGIERLVKQLLDEISFEIRHFGIFRLEDHISIINEMFLDDFSEIEINNIKLEVMKALRGAAHKNTIDLRKIEKAQLTFQHPEVIEFYQEQHQYHLLEKTGVFPNRIDPHFQGVFYGFYALPGMRAKFRIRRTDLDAKGDVHNDKFGGSVYRRALEQGGLEFSHQVLAAYHRRILFLRAGDALLPDIIGFRNGMYRLRCRIDKTQCRDFIPYTGTLLKNIELLDAWCRDYDQYRRLCCLFRWCCRRAPRFPVLQAPKPIPVLKDHQGFMEKDSDASEEEKVEGGVEDEAMVIGVGAG